MQTQETDTQRLGTERIGRLLWEFSVPAIVGSAVMALYNVVDRLFIGRGCGTQAMAGLTLTFPYMMVLASFGVLFGVGSAALISIRLGENRQDEAEKLLGQAIALKLSFVVLPMLALVFLDRTIGWFGGNALTTPYARDYLRIVLWGNVFAHLGFGMSAFMRAEGHARKSMICMLIGAGANVILDPIFIFGLGWGMRGAAMATVGTPVRSCRCCGAGASRLASPRNLLSTKPWMSARSSSGSSAQVPYRWAKAPPRSISVTSRQRAPA